MPATTGLAAPLPPAMHNHAPLSLAGHLRGLVRAAAAFWHHDVSEAFAHPQQVVHALVRALTVLALLWFVGQAVDAHAPGVIGAQPFFAFAAPGYVALQLAQVTLGAFRARLRRYQRTGFLEACVMTRTALWKTLLVMPAWDLMMTVLWGMGVTWFAFAQLPLPPEWSALGASAGLLALALVVFTATGMLSAALTLALRGGDPLARVLWAFSLLFAGTYVPRDLLPEPLATVGAWLPVGALLDGVRLAVLELPHDPALPSALVRLSVLAALTIPAALLAARAAIRQALRDGSLSHP